MFLVTQRCVGVKDLGCIDVCPVDCIHDGGDQVWIDPDGCIDCGFCALVCPVDAIVIDERGDSEIAFRG